MHKARVKHIKHTSLYVCLYKKSTNKIPNTHTHTNTHQGAGKHPGQPNVPIVFVLPSNLYNTSILVLPAVVKVLYTALHL